MCGRSGGKSLELSSKRPETQEHRGAGSQEIVGEGEIPGEGAGLWSQTCGGAVASGARSTDDRGDVCRLGGASESGGGVANVQRQKPRKECHSRL